MASDVSIDFPKEDVRELFRQINRASDELGKDMSNAVRWGGWFVATSLGAATKLPSKHVVASKKRRVAEEVETEGRRKRGELKTFKARRYTKSGRRDIEFKAASKAEANKSDLLKINLWGLAKASWMWSIKPLGKGAKFGFATPKASTKAQQSITVVYRKDKTDPMVKIENRLPYIRKALKGGESAVSTAMGKAARNMSRSIDSAIEKRLLRRAR